VGLHIIYNDEIVYEYWNVLAQLSFTILVTFLLMRYSIKTQLIASLLFLLLTEILYRSYDPAAPFVKDQNFGSWMDMILMGKINPGGGWVVINCLPTAAHTIWGAICAKLLLSDKTPAERMKYLLIAGGAGLVLGYGLHYGGITPIVKRIATTSFVFASGGWCLLALAFFYWFVDLKGNKNWIKPFTIVGMNSIFIYLFAETVGHQYLGKKVMVFTNGYLSPLGVGEHVVAIVNSILVLAIMWYLCKFLY
jgi:predicted acyltransferase